MQYKLITLLMFTQTNPHFDSTQAFSNVLSCTAVYKKEHGSQLLSTNVDNKTCSRILHKNVSQYLKKKWQPVFDYNVADNILCRSKNHKPVVQTLKSINKKGLMDKREYFLLINVKITYIEKYFSHTEAVSHCNYLKKIYKYGFNVPYIKNRYLHVVRAKYYSFLKRLRNMHLKSKNYQNNEKNALECSFDIYNMYKYVKKNNVITEINQKLLKDKVLHYDMYEKHNISKSSLFISKKTKRVGLLNLNRSAIEAANDSSDTMHDLLESINALKNTRDDRQEVLYEKHHSNQFNLSNFFQSSLHFTLKKRNCTNSHDNDIYANDFMIDDLNTSLNNKNIKHEFMTSLGTKISLNNSNKAKNNIKMTYNPLVALNTNYDLKNNSKALPDINEKPSIKIISSFLPPIAKNSVKFDTLNIANSKKNNNKHYGTIPSCNSKAFKIITSLADKQNANKIPVYNTQTEAIKEKNKGTLLKINKTYLNDLKKKYSKLLEGNNASKV